MGTPYFWSLTMAKRHQFSRRDDVESIIYWLAYLIKGKLPWDYEYYYNEEEKHNPLSLDGNDWDKILDRKKNISETDVWERLPIDMKHLFKYAIRIEPDQEPDYDYVLNTLTHLRNKSLKIEDVKEPHTTALTTGKHLHKSSSLGSKVVSKINYNSILSQIKVSGMEINLNSISTVQQNKTLNSVNFTKWSNPKYAYLYRQQFSVRVARKGIKEYGKEAEYI